MEFILFVWGIVAVMIFALLGGAYVDGAPAGLKLWARLLVAALWPACLIFLAIEGLSG